MSGNLKYRGVNELRKSYLDFFESKEHLKLKSFSLVPHNDNSLLLINSGMAPLKPYFTGQEKPPKKRITTCQKCIRTGDIENVGKTARHGTFFEMLGNFSFGDYFKKEAIFWSWEFLTEVIGLDKNRLYPSVYLEDDEAFEIWNKEVGIEKERIFRFGKEDNFWEHGAGPCGPCSEIYYDRGEKYGCKKPDCTVGCECDRYMEIWNNVFTQFENDGNNNYTELSQKNIDTGMGLERLAVVVQDVDSIFDVDTLYALRDSICKMCGAKYKEDEKKDISIRVITDHIRSVTFMVSDGIMPSNEGRGYVLRRLLRRAARHGRFLSIDGLFLDKLAKVVIDNSKNGYKELEEKQDFILEVIRKEEEKFNNTLDQGLVILSEIIEKMQEEKENILSGENAFKLYDTYGFPLDLTKEILEDKNMEVDEEAFKKEMEKQREAARNARKTSNYMGAEETVFDRLDKEITTEFVGYDRLTEDSTIAIMTKAEKDGKTYIDKEEVESLNKGEHGTIITYKTPFYATMGGQNGDIGKIVTSSGEFVVTDTINLKGAKIGHIGYVLNGTINLKEKATLMVDEKNRENTCKNHTATHLLHASLKNVIGSHVEQSGSDVNANRLRFDFTHFMPLSKEEIKEVEKIINEQIAKDDEVCTKIMSLEEAKKSGATALFGEKYGDSVRVVSAGSFSKELCGGTHVKSTGSIAAFKIISETGIAAGVRRIEALTADALFKHYEEMERELLNVGALLKCETQTISLKLTHLLEDMKKLQAENESLKAKIASNTLSTKKEEVVEVDGIKVVTARLDNIDINEMRSLGDSLKEKYENSLVVLSGASNDKVNIVAMAAKGAVEKNIHAGKIIKELASIVKGSGGGRENMATAGGSDVEKIDEMLASVSKILKK